MSSCLNVSIAWFSVRCSASSSWNLVLVAIVRLYVKLGGVDFVKGFAHRGQSNIWVRSHEVFARR